MIGCEGSCMRGTCVNGSCVCNSEWSGHADLFTQDLSPWNGPVLNCPAHIPTLKAIWTTCLILALSLFLMLPFSICQQWRKFKALQHEHAWLHWFKYYPLAYLLWLEVVVLPLSAALAAVKLASDDMSEVIGATSAASTMYGLLQLLGPLVAFPYLRSALDNFGSFGLDDASADARVRVMVRIVSAFCACGILVSSAASVYPVVSVSRSPYSQRHVHLLCARLFFAQTALSYAAISVASTLMGIKVVLSINHTISNRLDLCQQSRQDGLRATLPALRRTRMKLTLAFGIFVVMLLSIAFTSSATSVYASRLLYASYILAFVTTGFPGIGILGALTYTDLPQISIWRQQNQLRSEVEFSGPQQCSQQQRASAANRDHTDASAHQPLDLNAHQDSPDHTVVDIAGTDELEQTEHERPEVQPTRQARWDDGEPAHLVA